MSLRFTWPFEGSDVRYLNLTSDNKKVFSKLSMEQESIEKIPRTSNQTTKTTKTSSHQLLSIEEKKHGLASYLNSNKPTKDLEFCYGKSHFWLMIIIFVNTRVPPVQYLCQLFTWVSLYGQCFCNRQNLQWSKEQHYNQTIPIKHKPITYKLLSQDSPQNFPIYHIYI